LKWLLIITALFKTQQWPSAKWYPRNLQSSYESTLSWCNTALTVRKKSALELASVWARQKYALRMLNHMMTIIKETIKEHFA